MKRVAMGVAALVLAMTMPTASRAQNLTPAEDARLVRGDTVAFPQTIEKDDDRRYVGGITYTIVDAAPAELEAMLTDARAYLSVLPHTKEARFVGRDGEDWLVELVQGSVLVQVTYTMRVRIDRPARTARFWMDATRPHTIADAWGYFRYEPLAQVKPGVPRALLTYGALVDIGPGLGRGLFEERVRAAMLSVPSRVERYVTRTYRAKRVPRG